MWKKYQLKLPQGARNALEPNTGGAPSAPFSLSIRGSKIGVHNWSHGLRTASNFYLSPENAAKAIQTKLTDYQDPNRPTGVQDIVVIMLTCAKDDEFIAGLEKIGLLLADSSLKQALDYARAYKKLAETKMIKTIPIAHPAFSKPADITPQSARELNAVMRGVQALNEKSGDPFEEIKKLKAKKAQKQAEQREKVNALLSAQVEVQAFCARGFVEEIALNLMSGLPFQNYVFTAMICFVGEDLNQLRGLLHELNQ